MNNPTTMPIIKTGHTLLFLFLSFFSAFGEHSIDKLDFTGEENAKPIKAIQLEEFRSSQKITVENATTKLGNPVGAGEFGRLGLCLVYKGNGDATYLFQVGPGKSNKSEPAKFEVLAIILWLAPFDPDEKLIIWESLKEGENKN